MPLDVGLPEKPLELPIFPLVIGWRIIGGSNVGGIKETQEMLDFCSKHNITADIELIRIDELNEAMERLAKSDVKYWFVIDVGNSLSKSVFLVFLCAFSWWRGLVVFVWFGLVPACGCPFLAPLLVGLRVFVVSGLAAAVCSVCLPGSLVFP
ncbi:hypothetical protein Q3G72_030627 [Acer saccharum]|nr:hypothetical protein Q3G72_030627 [Acer saccharum]